MKHPPSQPESWWSHHPQANIVVRPLLATDADLIEAMHQRLSPESLYYRYLQYRKPTAAEIAAVCRLDPAHGSGFVAIVPDEPTTIVGLAYYVREAHEPEPTAEPGILVEDRFQEQGVGRRLWQELQQHAQHDGLRWLRVLAHPHNERMARLVRGGGLPYATKSDGGLNEFLVALNEQPYLSQWSHVDDYARYSANHPNISPILLSRWRSVRERLTVQARCLGATTIALLTLLFFAFCFSPVAHAETIPLPCETDLNQTTGFPKQPLPCAVCDGFDRQSLSCDPPHSRFTKNGVAL